MNELLLIVIAILAWLLFKFLRKDAVFIPLPMGTVRKMLKLAKVRKSDVLYDLGSGDGRIVVTAAKEYGIKSVGVEKSRFLCWLSNIKVKRNGVQNKVKIIHGDLFKQKISDATIITVYLRQKLNDRLEPELKKLNKGTRIISADHTFKNIKEANKMKAGHFYLRLYKV